MKRRDKIIIWPVYFDAQKSRRMGRKVPLSLAVKKISIKEIELALKKLNLKYEIEPNKKHPAVWFEYSDRLLIEKPGTMSKNMLLKIIAKKIRELRNIN